MKSYFPPFNIPTLQRKGSSKPSNRGLVPLVHLFEKNHPPTPPVFPIILPLLASSTPSSPMHILPQQTTMIHYDATRTQLYNSPWKGLQLSMIRSKNMSPTDETSTTTTPENSNNNNNSISAATGNVDDDGCPTTTTSSSQSELVQKYGPLVWKTYWGVYFGTLFGLFFGIETGMMNPLLRWLIGRRQRQRRPGGDTSSVIVGSRPHHQVSSSSLSPSEFAVDFMQRHRRLAPYAGRIKSSPLATNLTLAWLIAEASEPLRIAATGILVPIIANNNPVFESRRQTRFVMLLNNNISSSSSSSSSSQERK